jgi:xanthine dehydrogenase accessory factor
MQTSILARMGSDLLSETVLIRGGGDLASGIALRLHRCGVRVLICELAAPLAVRRRVSFAEAVFSGVATVEDCTACRVADSGDKALVNRILAEGRIPVLIDPHAEALRHFQPAVVIDARMLKDRNKTSSCTAKLTIGLGPGFVAGENCDLLVETKRGITLGRVVRSGSAEPDTRVPEPVAGQAEDRVLRSPAQGTIVTHAEICDRVKKGQLLAEVDGFPVHAPFDGVLRGLIHSGLNVAKGVKIGDVDPRGDPRSCVLVSDKSLAIAGGVLEAILGSGNGRVAAG